MLGQNAVPSITLVPCEKSEEFCWNRDNDPVETTITEWHVVKSSPLFYPMLSFPVQYSETLETFQIKSYLTSISSPEGIVAQRIACEVIFHYGQGYRNHVEMALSLSHSKGHFFIPMQKNITDWLQFIMILQMVGWFITPPGIRISPQTIKVSTEKYMRDYIGYHFGMPSNDCLDGAFTFVDVED